MTEHGSPVGDAQMAQRRKLASIVALSVLMGLGAASWISLGVQESRSAEAELARRQAEDRVLFAARLQSRGAVLSASTEGPGDQVLVFAPNWGCGQAPAEADKIMWRRYGFTRAICEGLGGQRTEVPLQ